MRPIPPAVTGQPALPPPIAELVHAIGRRHRYERGSTLFHAGDAARGIHVVLEGRIRVRRIAPSGRTVVVHHEGVGGLLGEIPLFDGGLYPATAQATERSACALLPRLPLLRRLDADAALARYFLTRLAGRLREVIGRLDAMATRSVAQRVSRYLVGRWRASGSTRVSLGMSQADLAEELGTVREVVVRELRLLCRAGLLAPLGAGRYIIKDERALRALAE